MEDEKSEEIIPSSNSLDPTEVIEEQEAEEEQKIEEGDDEAIEAALEAEEESRTITSTEEEK